MSLITITYQGRRAALAGHTRVWPQPWLCALPAGHPTRSMTLYMCHYARLILAGELPGPYTDDQARRFARLALVSDHDDLQACSGESDHDVAARLGIPADELAPARDDRAQPASDDPPAASQTAPTRPPEGPARGGHHKGEGHHARPKETTVSIRP